MSKVNQKTAVYNAVTSVAEVNNNRVDLSKAEREQVVSILVNGFETEQIELSSKQENIRKYTIGLLNNWLRKDTRLNGGDKYEAKNPGSRTGQADPVIKNLRAMLKTGITEEQRNIVNKAIQDRVATAKVTKQVEVDYSLIPEDIKQALGL